MGKVKILDPRLYSHTAPIHDRYKIDTQTPTPKQNNATTAQKQPTHSKQPQSVPHTAHRMNSTPPTAPTKTIY